jgi:hypothetical protein
MKQVKTILEFDEGSILEKANIELRKVLENIADKNTSTKARTITIKLLLTPDEKRRHVEMSANVTSTLQPLHAIKTSMGISIGEDGIEAVELTGIADGQKDIFGNTAETKIIKMPTKTIGGNK